MQKMIDVYLRVQAKKLHDEDLDTILTEMLTYFNSSKGTKLIGEGQKSLQGGLDLFHPPLLKELVHKYFINIPFIKKYIEVEYNTSRIELLRKTISNNKFWDRIRCDLNSSVEIQVLQAISNNELLQW